MPPGTSVTIFSDYICPFCHIAEGRIAALVEKHPDLEVNWEPFEIHPETPQAGVNVDDVFPKAYLEAARRNIRALAADAGVTMGDLHRMSNSRKAHALGVQAKADGLEDGYHSAVLKAYWEDGQDIGNEAILLEIWSSLGGDPDHARKALDDSQNLDIESEPLRLGLSGVPTFIFAGPKGRRMVVGAQPLAVIEAALEQVSGDPSGTLGADQPMVS